MASILIVDDDNAVRLLLHRTLSDAGHDVLTAAGPNEALEILRSSKCFDLIICDILMPEMNGHELTRRIAIHCPKSRVLHISGFDPGCDGCPYINKCPLIEKPFLRDELMVAINDALGDPPRKLRT